MKDRRKYVFVFALLSTMTLGAWAQVGLGNIPKTVKASDARITDIGVVTSDMLLWAVENEKGQTVDTLMTHQTYILWQSEGDLDRQAEQHRAQAADIRNQHRAQIEGDGVSGKGAHRVSAVSQKGILNEYLAEFQYYVYTFEYPSVDADGNAVTLSGIAGCPTKDADEVRDVVIGTHITITSNDERPSARTDGFKASDWGVLLSMAAGKKMRLGWKANLYLGLGASGYAGIFFGPLVGVVSVVICLPVWAGVGIAAEVKSGDDAYNNNLVIMADYEGYGVSKDRAHPYLYQELTARQVVDATRYGIALYKNDPGLADIRHPIRSDFRSISCGYSQGGSVALATHRFIEQNGLTNELHFAGSLCGDGPYDPMATLMYYMRQCKDDHRHMSMPVVLPLIVKGMLDTNPYMTGHKAADYFNPKFLETGIMDWLASKECSTNDIEKKFDSCYKNGKDGDEAYFRDLYVLDKNKNPHLMMSSIMNEACYNYFSQIYEDNKSTFTSAAGIPLPTKRGVMEDLHLALASNDMTKGWTPQHTILMFHSNSDTVVPYENATSAVNSLGGWTVLKTSTNGHDHNDSGTDFFQGDKMDIVGTFAIQMYVAKKRLCELQWQNQAKGSITEW